MEIPSSLRHPPEDSDAARMAVEKVKKKCNLNLSELFIPHTKIERKPRLRGERKFAGLKSRNNMQKG
jgi:hypothetical protein